MLEFLNECFGDGRGQMYLEAILVTVKITVIATAIAYIVGIPLGVILYGTSKDGIFPNAPVNSVVGFIVNMIRSIPFVILLIITQPLSKAVMGTMIGDSAFIFYLDLASIPFVARMVESSLREVDRGVIEAAQSMGSNNLQIIMKVLIPEAKPSLLVGCAIATTTILGYTPMTYLIAGGGLGQIAIQYGLYRRIGNIMYIASLLLIILVQIIQVGLSFLAKKCDKRIRGK